MKDIISEALSRQVAMALDASGGVRALYGEPISYGDEEIVPIARITLELTANAEGSGSGKSGLAALARSSGGGGGTAGAGVRVHIDPVGFLRQQAGELVFVPLESRQH